MMSRRGLSVLWGRHTTELKRPSARGVWKTFWTIHIYQGPFLVSFSEPDYSPNWIRECSALLRLIYLSQVLQVM